MTSPAPTTAPPEGAGADHYVAQIVAAAAAEPARPVVFWRDGCVRGGDLAEAVLDAAAALEDLGVGAGSTVAVLMAGNRPAQLVARYAAHLLGAAVVHIRSMNPRTEDGEFTEEAQAELLRSLAAGVLVADAEHGDRARRLQAATGLSLATTGTALPGITTLASARARRIRRADPDPRDRAGVGFTSGSTGRPKAVAQSFGVWNHLVALLAGPPATRPTPPVRLLAVTPMAHAVAPMIDAALAAGGSVVLHDAFDADAVLHCVEWLRVTDTYLAVPHLYRLLDHPAFAAADTSSLRKVVYSGTPASPARVAEAAAVLGPALVQVYGTSETGGISVLTGADHAEPLLLGTAGRPFPWVDVQLRDPDTGMTVAAGEIGEVCVSSPTLMDGHLDEPGDPEDIPVRTRDGRVRTGDLGRFDERGYLVLVGRLHQVIKSGGLKVYPTTVARALLEHAAVADAAVYARVDAELVEHVHAAVRLRPGTSGAAGELADHVERRLGPAHRPARVTFWDAVPVTAQGKPDTAYLAGLDNHTERN